MTHEYKESSICENGYLNTEYIKLNNPVNVEYSKELGNIETEPFKYFLQNNKSIKFTHYQLPNRCINYKIGDKYYRLVYCINKLYDMLFNINIIWKDNQGKIDNKKRVFWGN